MFCDYLNGGEQLPRGTLFESYPQISPQNIVVIFVAIVVVNQVCQFTLWTRLQYGGSDPLDFSIG